MNLNKSKKIKISTWNVNGIRAAFPKGLEEYLEKSAPHILCLQEIKAFEEQIPEILKILHRNYRVFFHSAKRPGYSGVATLIHKDLFSFWNDNISVKNGIDQNTFDVEGRMQIITTPEFILFGGYYPNGQRDHSRVGYKLEFSEQILKMAKKLSEKTKQPIFLCGDFNTAHREIDLKNPKTNLKTTGFLPEERAFIDQMLHTGFFDLYREFYPHQIDAYTWWTYRGDCRERNIGWRLDYFFGNHLAKTRTLSVQQRTDVVGSDHCPVEIEIKLEA